MLSPGGGGGLESITLFSPSCASCGRPTLAFSAFFIHSLGDGSQAISRMIRPAGSSASQGKVLGIGGVVLGRGS